MNYLFNKQKQEQQKQLKRIKQTLVNYVGGNGDSPIGNDGC